MVAMFSNDSSVYSQLSLHLFHFIYNRHSNTMSLAKGIYRIRMWGAHEHPRYLSIIDGMVSIAGPDVPNIKDQEVTRRF